MVMGMGGAYELWMLLWNLLSLYAPPGLHKGFLTVKRVWVQAAVYSGSICLVPEGSHVGLFVELLLLVGFG